MLFGPLLKVLAFAKVENLCSNPQLKVRITRIRSQVRWWLDLLNNVFHKTPVIPRAERYDIHWGYTSFKGKTVLDVGADYGSTAKWFLSKGAKRVVAVEGNSHYAWALRTTYGSHPQVVCIQHYIRKPETFERLVHTFKPDIVKVDIEGSERLLAAVDKTALRVSPEWLVETHGDFLERQVTKAFVDAGFSCEAVYRAAGHHGYPTCTILHAHS